MNGSQFLSRIHHVISSRGSKVIDISNGPRQRDKGEGMPKNICAARSIVLPVARFHVLQMLAIIYVLGERIQSTLNPRGT